MQLTEKHREYWHKNLVITAILMVVWFIATFVEGWYARELNGTTFLGFPLGFYMSAQGSLIIYVVIICIYARYMNALDIDLRRARGGRPMSAVISDNRAFFNQLQASTTPSTPAASSPS